ncbi:uncharacterized protein LOC113359340 [Papaver somniferum]|uniref:uncharacterized protein LOC113359340 n=1 Tax=Papaver somniferum TaxID=3469 RepID=UPI000E6F55D7|nr:uncharacterized protein LOC113359340 [Papaver somniferum]
MIKVLFMGVISKTEVNLRRLLATAPQQKNQAKLIHYVATLREQLEQLAAERFCHCLIFISVKLKDWTRKTYLYVLAKVSDYSEKIEALAATIAEEPPVSSESSEAFDGGWVKEIPLKPEQGTHIPSPRLRRRSHYKVEDRSREIKESDSSAPIKLGAEAHAHIDKHRKLQEDLTDEMVGLAQRLKESSLMMSRSIEDTEKVLDSTERAVEHSLASTGNANARAMEIYSRTFNTTCFTWLLFFVMICVFIMVILLIRVT